MKRLRQAAATGLARWAERRHGRDALPLTVHRRRIYILPTRSGLALGLLLAAMLLAGLNYNSNLGLAFGFLMTSLALVAMHHCHRNLLGLGVDAEPDADGFAGGEVRFAFWLINAAGVERCDIEVRCAGRSRIHTVPAHERQPVVVPVPLTRRGVIRLERFELRTRYPFGWFRAWTYVQAPLTAHGAPRPGGELTPPGSAAASGGGVPAAEPRGEEDFAGLRSYAAGVPLKHMAWKVLARGGEPAVRSYSGLAAQPQWLEWSALTRLDEEGRLSQLCQWVLQSDAAQREYGLRLPGTEIAPSRGLSHRTACLRALAAHPPASTAA